MEIGIMQNVNIEFTAQEVDSLVRALDMGVKAYGIMLAQDILPIVGKISQAAQSAQEPEPELDIQ